MPIPTVPGTKIKLLSAPGKMPCMTWSLEAHTTCPGAVYGDNMICSHCYAQQGSYLWPDVRRAQLKRAEWTMTCLMTPWGRDEWVRVMTAAVKWASRVIPGRPGYWITRRARWTREYVYKARVNARGKRIPARRIPPRYVPAHRAYRPATEAHQMLYFRVHDSGDLFSPAYTQMWTRVCANLPEVRFWFPTRMWPHGGKAVRLTTIAAVQELAALPNVTVRPSALQFDDPAPTVDGYGPGSSAAREGYNCPAHEQNNECRACRACWDSPDGVIYRYHGGLNKRPATRRPAAPLITLARATQAARAAVA